METNTMNEQQARKILDHDGGYKAAARGGDDNETCLDGDFTIEQLKAIVWWLENRPGEEFPEPTFTP